MPNEVMESPLPAKKVRIIYRNRTEVKPTGNPAASERQYPKG